MPITIVTPLPSLNRSDPNFKTQVNTFFATQLPVFTNEVNAQASDVAAVGVQVTADKATTTAAASAADASAIAAAASAVTALNAPGTSGTSTTSLTIGAGAQSFTTQSGKAWVVGQPVIIARTSAPGTTRMSGTITAYNAGTGAMTVEVDAAAGAGTYTDWTISLGTARAPDSLPTQTIVANTTAVTGFHYLLAAGGITLTLPAVLPAKDLCIAFSNVSSTTTPAVNFNGHKLRGRLPGVMQLDTFDARAMLQSTGNATYGWA